MSFQDLRERCDIVEFISDVTLLEGDDALVGQCPFGHHDEYHDLQVNRIRQSWKCDTCEIGGDVFSFVMMRDQVEFSEAVEIVKTWLDGDGS